MDESGERVVTIKDIAQMAGVSFTTVSKALNGEPGVRPSTREKIIAIANKLNYVPNLAARRLVDRKSDSIGLIWPQNDSLFLHQVFRAFHAEAEAKGYSVIVSLGEPAEALQSFAKHFVDAVVLWSTGGTSSPSFVQAQQSFRGSMLMLNSSERPDMHTLSIDRQEAMFQAVEHLVGLGHRRISLVGFNSTKMFGFEQAAQHFGLPSHPDRLLLTPGTDPSSWERVAKVLCQPPAERPTAIVADSHGSMFKLLKLCYKLAIRIPDSFSLVAYDDIPGADEITPVAVTTVGPHVGQMASMAFELLAAGRQEKKQEQDEEPRCIHQIIPSHLTLRETTRPVEAYEG